MPFDLRQVVEEVAQPLSYRAEERGIDLILRYSSQAPRHFVGDPVRIGQIIANFANNAIKFTHDGHVLIDVELADACQGPDGSDAIAAMRLSIVDTGIGIAESKLETVFEKFTQADSSTTREYGGTGLGLAITKQLVTLMGGTISVTSRQGVGSTFSVTLPLQVNPAAPAETSLPEELDGLRALIVDDNAVNRRVLVESLGTWKMRCEEAEAGDRALAAIRAAQEAGDPYHFALLDYQMPSMDGVELAAKIRGTPAGADMALIMLTSVGFLEDAVRMTSAGFDAYMVKPVRQARLLETLLGVWSSGNAPPNGSTRDGSVVSSTAPRSATNADPEPDEAEPERKPCRLLVAEDDRVNQLVITRMLAKLDDFDLRIDLAKDGSEAVRLVRSRHYDLVFMDCQMPVLDGYDATRAIRELEHRSLHIPIVALTANALTEDRQRCIDAGMDDYVSKPVRLSALRDVLARQLDPDRLAAR